MKYSYDEFHANKSERLKSFENTVKNIFDEKLKKIGDCFEKAKIPESVTTSKYLTIMENITLKKVNNNFKGTLRDFDIERQHPKNVRNLKSLHNNINFKRYLYYTRYILFSTVSSKNLMCNQDRVLDQDLECFVDEEELRHYVGSNLLDRLCESL